MAGVIYIFLALTQLKRPIDFKMHAQHGSGMILESGVGGLLML